MQSLTHAYSYYSFHKSHHAAAARPVHACCLFGVTWFGLDVLYVYCSHFMILQYGFSFLDSDPFESLYSSSLGTSEELPFYYAMKTLEEQGTLSEQPLMKGMCHMPCSCDSYC